MRHRPQAARGVERLDAGSLPPIDFLAGTVQFAMTCAAKRDGEFIANFLRESTRLRKTQMVQVAGLASADETWLFGDKA